MRLIDADMLTKAIYEDGEFPLTLADRVQEKINEQPTVSAFELLIMATQSVYIANFQFKEQLKKAAEVMNREVERQQREILGLMEDEVTRLK